ncbi:MAG: exodeoxyribonuclease VII large subunit [Muribaculaceae bacterium]|nr:exodeoxyribonuclease VII large subunit [Muribaculaceae bacterium]
MEPFNRQDVSNALTLSQFSRFVAAAMSREPVLMGAWVTAEISDMSSSGGHCYMTLIEKDASGATVARMRATIWATRFAFIRRKFFEATKRDLANGMKVMFYGGTNYHSSYGLSFNIGDIEPSFTMGDLERLRREILAALQREGVIDRNRNLKITDPPLKIAVISSEKAAGYGDFINQLNNNPSGIEFHTLLFPAIMQGDKTAASVIDALDRIEQTDCIAHWDCVVIVRGGGATTDMNGFDDLQLARRVATFPIPIIVGIGHERDRCVLDEIACVRCKTPTAVATWLSDFVSMAWQRACDLTSLIASFASERLKGEQIRLQSIETMIPALADSGIKNARIRLQGISALLPALAREATSKARIRIEALTTALRIASHSRIEKEFPVLQAMASALRLGSVSILEKEKSRLDSLQKLTEALNPTSTLKRGYSITRVGGKAITSATEINPGDVLETQTADGRIVSTADRIPDIITQATSQPHNPPTE